MHNTSLLLSLILFSALHGFILGLIIFFKDKKGNSSNRIFAIILFLFSLYLFEFFGAYSGIWPQQLTFITYPSLFFIGPLFLFYKSSLLDENLSSKIKMSYLLPAIFIYISFLPFYYMNFGGSSGQYSLESTGDSFFNLSYIFFLRVPWLFPMYTLGFIIYTYLQFSSGIKKGILTKKIECNLFVVRSRWFKNLLKVLITFFLLSTFYELTVYLFELPFSTWLTLIQYFLLSLIILAIGYWALINPTIFANLKPVGNGEKYKTSSINEAMAKSLLKEIIDFLEQKKPYLDENMTLQTLTDETDISKHNISQVINQELDISFFNLINKYRIEDVKKILLNKSQPQTVQDLAYSVGFGNKVSFYRAFKSVTGESFADFKKRL